ncbi:exodeoxyribonuclease VII large subunit [Thalassoroseus pseudoceratinae]|uniref:exodeoxyribonuclease VII large subunit n=1 Tax=Thalassoroseus pseudoceratinae TaxID=2713176 RepID=UPI001420B3FA|nr:exodeoxyribonuclease VII large subunit [Thalassoroseus pseudoceratinae]
MPELEPLTVTELTQQIKGVMEMTFPHMAVLGELSNCVRAGSGHVYLTLKDSDAQIRGVIWRRAASKIKFDLADGLEVVAVGGVEVYPPRGQYQLIIEELLPQGIGALELAFRQLQEKLAREGLFDPERKRPLPRFPKRIAIVTSPTSAAVRDMLQVITRRWNGCNIVILPVAVQGAKAAGEIANAIRSAPSIPDVDVIIVGRGGGSLEDLWSFNEEIVARAIFDCPLPVVSAVGHEIDVSISDLVADVRALTPSEAGELVVPHRQEVAAEIQRLQDRLIDGLRGRITTARSTLENLASRRAFTRPLDRVHQETRTVDELSERLSKSIRRVVATQKQRIDGLSETLDSLSPLKVLSRGYCVARNPASGDVIRSVRDVAPNEPLEILLRDGRLQSRIETVEPTETDPPSANQQDS